MTIIRPHPPILRLKVKPFHNYGFHWHTCHRTHSILDLVTHPFLKKEVMACLSEGP